MKLSLSAIFFLLVIVQVHPYLRKEQREELLKKVSNKITPSDRSRSKPGCEDIFCKYYENFEAESFKAFNYNVTEIKKLIEKYNLPLEYDFFNETEAIANVKDQGNCGCCWSFSATSALAYRFHKKGIEVDLSPQDAVSCYKGDLEGNSIIDPQLNLVKNGTLTEQCFPYVSGDGKTLPKCPSKCNNESIEFKKYHSQNAYHINNFDQSNFNDVVLLVMDQIVTQGPIVGGMPVYSDFMELAHNKTKCQNEIYTYDGISKIEGGHAVSIVGYGLLDNKFYWIVQNSWGKNWCDDGFFKMEINQFAEFGFSEAYVEKNIKPVEIDANYQSLSNSCDIQVKTDSLNQWNNTLSINFENKKTKQILDIQIGKVRILGEDTLISNFQINRPFQQLNKGIYEFKDYQSLGKENTFSLSSFENLTITFYGDDTITAIKVKNLYISEVGSKIVFFHQSYSNDAFPPVFLHQKEFSKLENCEHLKALTNIGSFGVCEIEQSNLDFLEKNTNSILFFNKLCGSLEETDINVYLLDKTKYPVFRINQFFLPNNTYIDNETDIIINAYVEGSTKFYSNDDNQFYAFIDIEYSNKNQTALFDCSAEIPFIENKKSNLTCHLIADKYEFDNLYLLPYSVNNKMSSPFEVIIEQTIKAGDDPLPPQPGTDTTEPDTTDNDTTEPETTAPITPTGSWYLKYSLYFLISILLL